MPFSLSRTFVNSGRPRIKKKEKRKEKERKEEIAKGKERKREAKMSSAAEIEEWLSKSSGDYELGARCPRDSSLTREK